MAGQPQVAALERLEPLQALWQAIGGNRDRSIDAISGHRSIEAGPLWLVLVDTSTDVFTKDDAAWLDAELAAVDQPIAIAIHQPPFETGIWWMDCVGLKHAERFEAIERKHPHVIKVVSGHIYRLIQSTGALAHCGSGRQRLQLSPLTSTRPMLLSRLQSHQRSVCTHGQTTPLSPT